MDRPKVGIGVFVMRGKEILVGKRKNCLGAGEWGLPGGHLEAGESFEDCCIRETLEETGITITKPIVLFDISNDIFEKEQLHYVTIFFIVTVDLDTEPKLMEPATVEEANLLSACTSTFVNDKQTPYGPFVFHITKTECHISSIETIEVI